MKTRYKWILYWIVGCMLVGTCCTKVLQKDFSGNYVLLGGEPLIFIRQNPDKSVWISYETYGPMSTQAKVVEDRIYYSFGGPTSILVMEKDGKTVSHEENGKVLSNIGRKIEDRDLWAAFLSFYQNKFVEAESGFLKYLQIHPDDLLIQLTLTKTFIQESKIKEAKTELAKFEHNSEMESNPIYKTELLKINYTLIGKEKSVVGQNAWDGYEEVLKLATAVPQGLPQNVYTRVYDMERHPRPLGIEEQNLIQQYIAPNMNAIQKLLSLPEKPECYITSATQPASQSVFQSLRALGFAKAVILYGRLQAEDGKVKEAAEAYRRVIRFGQQMMNGTIIPQLMGVAIRAIGEGGYKLLFNEGKISRVEDAQFVYNTLKELKKQEPFTTLESVMKFEAFPEANKEALKTFPIREQTAETRLILLETSAAMKLYQLKEGKSPQTLQDLVPTYLPELPVDTFTKNPIILKNDPDKGILIYSYGPDTTDDRGQILYDPTNGTISKGDLVFP